MSSNFAISMAGSAGSFDLRFAPRVTIPIELSPVYRGMRGEPGAPGEPGPVGSAEDMPDLSLVFENQLI